MKGGMQLARIRDAILARVFLAALRAHDRCKRNTHAKVETRVV